MTKATFFSQFEQQHAALRNLPGRLIRKLSWKREPTMTDIASVSRS